MHPSLVPLIVSLIVALAALAGSPARAQRAVEVFPPVVLHEGRLGGQVDSAFTVSNPTDVAMRVRIYPEDWHYQIDGAPSYLDAGSLPRSLAPYLTFNPAEVVLEPGESSEVRYTVNLPADADPGSYWGVLFMEGEDVDPEPGFELATFAVRVGHVVYVNAPPLAPAGFIGGVFGEPPSEATDPYKLGIQYINNGNAVQRLEGYVELRDAAGQVLFREEMPAIVSLPGDSVGRTFDVFGPLEPGNYTALVVYNYGDETTDIAADFAFTLEQALLEPSEGEGENATDTGSVVDGEGP